MSLSAKGIRIWDSSDPQSVPAFSGALATSLETILSKLEFNFYVWADQTERLAETGMTIGAFGYETSTGITYRHNGNGSNTGWKVWQKAMVSWTPVWSGITLGNATQKAGWGITDGQVYGWIALTFGSTTVVGTTPRFVKPYVQLADSIVAAGFHGVASFRDVSASDQWTGQVGVYSSDTTQFAIYRVAQSGTYSAAANGQLSAWTSTGPFATATGDVFYFEFRYPALNSI